MSGDTLPDTGDLLSPKRSRVGDSDAVREAAPERRLSCTSRTSVLGALEMFGGELNPEPHDESL